MSKTSKTARTTPAATATSPAAWWDNAETIESCGGCRECARFSYGGGHSDPACERHVYDHRVLVVIGLRTIFRDDPANTERQLRAVVKAKALFRFSGTLDTLWAAVMTLRFGPTGLHASRADAKGRPLPETMAMPAVIASMERATASVHRSLFNLGLDVTRFHSDRAVTGAATPL